MSKNVFILGAGASKHAGAPLMSEFMDVARGLRNTDQCFNRVFDAIEELKIVHHKTKIDLDNIESVFGAIEMARLIKNFSGYDDKKIDLLSKSIRRMITLTLESSIKLPIDESYPLATGAYNGLVQLIKDLRQGNNYDSSVITFNYDIVLDLAFYNSRTAIDYCLEESNSKIVVKYMKLHGSLNWGQCEECKLIVPWHMSDFFRKYHYSIWPGSTTTATIDIGSKIRELTHCDKNVNEEPVLVPPTWNKSEYQYLLSNVWKQAAKELSDAENIFIIGFSIPESDMFFRYLLALGSIGSGYIQRLWVFNTDGGSDIRKRYDELIGTGITKRYQYHQDTFEESIPFIRQALRTDK